MSYAKRLEELEEVYAAVERGESAESIALRYEYPVRAVRLFGPWRGIPAILRRSERRPPWIFPL